MVLRGWCNYRILKELCTCERSLGRLAPLSRSRWRGRKNSHNNRFTLHWVEILAETDDSRVYAIGGSNVEYHHVIVSVQDDAVEQRDHLSVAPARKSALEHRQLQPLTVSIHQPEYSPPTTLIANIVGDDKDSILFARSIHDGYLVTKFG